MFNRLLSDREAIGAFLKKYANGRYADSSLIFLPDAGQYLILIPSEIKPFSKHAGTLLVRQIRKKCNVDSQVMQLAADSEGITSKALAAMFEVDLKTNLVDVVVSTRNEKTDVLVYVTDPSKINDPVIRKSLHRKASMFLENSGVSLGDLWISEFDSKLPSTYQILAMVFTNAPIDASRLRTNFQERKFVIPSENWLKRQLDDLTRRKAIAWQPSNEFVLTEAGLSMISARTGKYSADVTRALALARKKW